MYPKCSHVTHPDAGVYIVCVDLSPQVLANPFLAQELLEEPGAVLQVVSTHSPLPRFTLLHAWSVVTCAALHTARTARFGQSV